MEDLHLRYADMKVEAATAREQATPLVARIKEMEEELTRVAASAEAIAGQLGAEQGAHLLTKGALAEASRVEALS